MSASSFDIRRFLTIRSASVPSFSPDGARLAFICDITGVPQVWSASLDGGWPEQLTYFPERVGHATYSPSENRILFSLDAGGDERHQVCLVSGDGQRVMTIDEDPQVMHNLGFWSRDGRFVSYASNRRQFASFDVYVADASSGETRRVLEHDGSNSAGRFSPDGRFLLASHTTDSANNDLYLIDLETLERTHLTPHPGQARYQMAQFTSDGRELYLISDEGREHLGIARLDVGSRTLTFIVEPDWDVEALELSPQRSKLAYCINVDGYSQLYVAETNTMTELRQADIPRGVVANLSWSQDEKWLAFTCSGPDANSNCWLLDTAQGHVRRVTEASTAGIPLSMFSTPELIRYQSFDGRAIPAFWYAPRGAAGKLPVVVHIHGGPESQARPAFNPVIQYLVHRGYAVLAPNVRGSTGYGREYVHLDDVRLRMDSVHDIKAAVDWLIATGRADPKRIACMGGSYGGFMVLACVTTYPELWAAGVDIVGIANWMTMLRNTSAWRRRLRIAEYGDPDVDGDFLREISPINHVDRISAPLIVIHGANDPRVPVSETEQIVGSLAQRGRPVEYLRFEDEGHGVVKLENRVRAYGAIAAFLDRHLRPSGA